MKINAKLTPLIPLFDSALIPQWMGLVLCLAIGQVQAASFDCGKAGTKVERLICADAQLSKLDDQLAAAYADALKSTDPASLKAEQKTWLKGRNTCMDAGCIKRAYESRLQTLSVPNTPAAPAASPAPAKGGGTTNNIVPSAKASAQTGDYWLDPAPKEMIDWNWEKYPAPQDKEVCGLYLKNLRYFAQRNEPLSCGQPIAPMLKDKIKAAEWENLDPGKYPSLAKEIVKRADFMQTEPSEMEAVDRVRYLRERSGFVFRRLKFELRGSPWIEVGSNRPLPVQEYSMVQYGADTSNPEYPNLADRCHPVLGKRVMHIGGDRPRLFVTTQDLAHVFGDVPDWRGMHIHNLWIINNRVYGERYDEKGDVKLTQLRLNYPVWFEAICLYHLKK